MNNVVNFSADTSHRARSEADHRITNNLSLISGLVRLKAEHLGGEDVRPFLMDVAGRIDTVARLHHLLAHADGGGIPVAHFLRDVCTAMKDIAGSDERIQTTIECPGPVTLSAQDALRVGLLTAELFSNSVKYAHPTGIPTFIRISCRPDRGTMVFSFEDDGIGFPENFDPCRSDSLGMKILRSLTHELHGACTWADFGIGLSFVCRFPVTRLEGQAEP